MYPNLKKLMYGNLTPTFLQRINEHLFGKKNKIKTMTHAEFVDKIPRQLVVPSKLDAKFSESEFNPILTISKKEVFFTDTTQEAVKAQIEKELLQAILKNTRITEKEAANASLNLFAIFTDPSEFEYKLLITETSDNVIKIKGKLLLPPENRIVAHYFKS